MMATPGLESRPKLSPFNLTERDSGIRLNLQDALRRSLSRVARPGISAVQPVHESTSVPPDAEDKDHSPGQRATHCLHASEFQIPVGAARLGAVLVVHVVDCRASCDVDAGVLDDLSALDVQAADLYHLSILGGELRHDGEGAARVDRQTRSEVLLVAECIRVIAAAPLVAFALEGTLVSSALVQSVMFAHMRRDRRCQRVGLPDVHLVTARALAFDVALVSYQQIS